jgi:hypothetical protein
MIRSTWLTSNSKSLDFALVKQSIDGGQLVANSSKSMSGHSNDFQNDRFGREAKI